MRPRPTSCWRASPRPCDVLRSRRRCPPSRASSASPSITPARARVSSPTSSCAGASARRRRSPASRSPDFGDVMRSGAGSGRSGNHTPGDAWAVVARPAPARRATAPTPRLADVASTIAAVCGVDGRRPRPASRLLQRPADSPARPSHGLPRQPPAPRPERAPRRRHLREHDERGDARAGAQPPRAPGARRTRGPTGAVRRRPRGSAPPRARSAPLAHEPAGAELRAVLDGRLGDVAQPDARGGQPAAPVAVLARRKRKGLVERHRAQRRPRGTRGCTSARSRAGRWRDRARRAAACA